MWVIRPCASHLILPSSQLSLKKSFMRVCLVNCGKLYKHKVRIIPYGGYFLYCKNGTWKHLGTSFDSEFEFHSPFRGRDMHWTIFGDLSLTDSLDFICSLKKKRCISYAKCTDFSSYFSAAIMLYGGSCAWYLKRAPEEDFLPLMCDLGLVH